jgi:transketolase
MDIENKIINTLRILSVDMIENANSGYPGMSFEYADLGESNKTFIKTNIINKDNFNGKYLHYGIRDHAMTSIANRMSTYEIIPIVSTFLVFITYCLAIAYLTCSFVIL